jgi:D-glycero-alpha-D-manno-heptose-7-phosphate kinase
MIIARAPFRISLGGGGTDLPSFYEKHEAFIFNLAIDKHIYVTLKPSLLDSDIKIKYSKIESVNKLSDLSHTRAREALKLYNINKSIEISSIADLPCGSGLGSSSSYLTALLTALSTYTRQSYDPHIIAEQACDIEINKLQEPIGKQDQYIAAYGGVAALSIDTNGTVSVQRPKMSLSALHTLVGNLHLYYTGLQRDASSILAIQNEKTKNSPGGVVETNLCKIKELSYKIYEHVLSENFDKAGILLDESWQLKKRLSDKVTLPNIEKIYSEVKAQYNVLGGKICGAGGGGFMMLYCHKNHKYLTEYMHSQGMYKLDYFIDFQGTRVVVDLCASHEINIDH